MAPVQRYGLKNNLVRWVHRHDRVATLFHSTRPGSALSASVTNIPVLSEASADPSQTLNSLSKKATTETPSVDVRVRGPVQRTVQPAAPPVQATSPDNSASVAKAEPSTSESKDLDWPRLQTILRKHQARTQEEAFKADTSPGSKLEEPQRADSPSRDKITRDKPEQPNKAAVAVPKAQPHSKVEAVDVPRSAQRVGQDRSKQDIQRSAEEPVQVNPLLQTDITHTAPNISSRHDASVQRKEFNIIQRVWHGVESIFRKPGEPVEPNPPPDSVETEEEPHFHPAEESSVLMDSTPQSSHPAMSFPDVVQQAPEIDMRSPARESVQTKQAFPLAPGSAVDIESSREFTQESLDSPIKMPVTRPQTEQPLPLESVWQVQRVQAPPSKTQMAVEMTEKAGETEIDLEPGAPHTEQPPAPPPGSSSPETSIEILPPSRPRPAKASVLPSRPAVQRQAETDAPSLVDTAIGPLPSDLWSLLGQKPPVNSGRTQTHQQPQQIVNPIDQNSASAQPTSTLAETSMDAAPVSRAIQRQAVSETPAQPASQGTDAEKERSPVEPDLNDLAQKVYAEIRRRLATESERTNRYL
jgi:hypothetical protein